MEKSYVSLEQHICPVCLKTFDTGNLLFDEQLRNIFERYTVTGYELCEEHKKVIGNLPKSIEKERWIAYDNRARSKPLRIDERL